MTQSTSICPSSHEFHLVAPEKKTNGSGGRPLGRRNKFANDINHLRNMLTNGGPPLSSVPKTPLDKPLIPPRDSALPRQRPLTCWKKLREEERALLIQIAIEESGGLAFTLNLSPDIEARATRSKRKPRDFIRDRISREMKRLSCHDHALLITLEHSKGGRLHVHGTILAPGQSPKDIKTALRRAGGKWAGPAGSKFQADVKPLQAAHCWHRYVAKEFRRMTQKEIKNSLSMNRSGRTLGRQCYEAMSQSLAAQASTRGSTGTASCSIH